MKKLMIAATAAFCATVGFSLESANIVGYNTVTLTEKWTILGVNFTGVDGNAMSINDAIPYAEGMVKGANVNTADQIQIQDGNGGYNTYYMSNGKNAKGGTVDGLEGKWAKAGTTTPSTDTVKNGTAFWYCRTTVAAGDPSLTLTIAGAVSLLASSDKQISETWVHIANPYPAELALNDGIPFTTGMTKGANINDADQIQIQDGAGGYVTYYMSNGKNAKGGTVDGLEGKWAKAGTTTATTDSIPVGKGAWFCRKGSEAITLTIANPIAE